MTVIAGCFAPAMSDRAAIFPGLRLIESSLLTHLRLVMLLHHFVKRGIGITRLGIAPENAYDVPLVALRVLIVMDMVPIERSTMLHIDTSCIVRASFSSFLLSDAPLVYAVGTNLESKLLGRDFFRLIPLMHHLVLKKHLETSV